MNKKVRIVLVILCVILWIVLGVHIEMIDRIDVFFNGLAGYDNEDYEETTKPLPECKFDIDFSTYDGKPRVIYEYDENVQWRLESIQYNGPSYTFSFISQGHSTFTDGKILDFANDTDIHIKNDYGEFIFCLMGENALEKNSKEYCFDLYPVDENFDMEKFTTMSVQLPLKGMFLKSYERN